MEEVDALPIDLGLELRDAAERSIRSLPVVVSSPVLGELAELARTDAALASLCR
ncbi:hypothetical protein BJ991_001086 [Microbacterium immunditiarum]|uniref:Uncharacterized protein n=1 Tax=Microbacterium immunditiarum TaxID=337480 RepID=A0A7Y9KKD7_9MICO|nr:hypothetical protein [Microbacterium immunditiarum]NYE19058.1 hypothetical protein [Microbacterium immunditiarum]